MGSEITVKDIRTKFRQETGQDTTIKTIRESEYRSGYPKKRQIEQYNPIYTNWLENFLIKLST